MQLILQLSLLCSLLNELRDLRQFLGGSRFESSRVMKDETGSRWIYKFSIDIVHSALNNVIIRVKGVRQISAHDAHIDRRRQI